MKIEVNGTCINTDDILKISNIKISDGITCGKHYFKITFTNNQSLYVMGDDAFVYGPFDELDEYEESEYNYQEKVKEMSFIKLTDLRNRIIKVWAENQLEIPKFNL